MSDHQSNRLEQKPPSLTTLMIMSSFASMGAVIFTPALPKIAQHFSISMGSSQLAITLFLVGYAIGQLVYGPVSNYFGRKKAFLIGVVIATIGSIISILSDPFNSFLLLVIGRVLEALGSSAGFVIAFAVVSDYYYPEAARKVISYMVLAFAIVPGIATMIGGFLVTHWGWLSCFYFLLVYGLLITLPVFLLSETLIKKNKLALNHKHIRRTYLQAFKNKTLVFASFFYGLAAICIYLFASGAPIIGIHVLGFSPQLYGLLGLIPFLGIALASVLNVSLSKKLSVHQLVLLGLFLLALGIVVLAILFAVHEINLAEIIICGFVFLMGACFVFSNMAGIATASSPDKGTASAVMTFIAIGMPVIGTLIQAVLPCSEVLKLPVLLVVVLIVMVVLFPIFKPTRPSVNG